MSPDVVVIGAGAIGTSIAYQLAKAGARVMIFDRGLVGRASTGASAGMLIARDGHSRPEAFATLLRESARLFPALADELRDRTGMDIGFRRSGVLQVAFDEAQARELRAQREWEVDHGAVVPWLDARGALDLEPAVNPAITAAIYHADDHHVLPLPFAQALARAAADLGSVVREGPAIDRLRIEADRVVGVAIGDEVVLADEVVIANGTWAGAWSEVLRVPIPVRPIRGQMVALRTPGTALRQLIHDADGYALTRADGITIAGTTVEDVGFDPRPTATMVARLLAQAAQLAPRLADATFVEAWAGLRPGTPDGLPMIGRLGEWRGLSIATGHFRNGILLAPITGELIADLLLRRQPRLALDDFDPTRFVVRAA